MSGNHPPPSVWWGTYELNQDQGKLWRIGPLSLLVCYLGKEWQVAYERTDDFDDNEVTWSLEDTQQQAEELSHYSRYIFRETSGLLSITPRLADRPVISRPRAPFNLLAGEEVTLYVSTPVWLSLAAGEAAKQLQEIPIQRASDTWFGPSTREGELCYASTTHCRHYLEELPQRPHRAITPLLIRNQADSTLSVERLNVPAPLLSLYATDAGQLWTPQVTLIREKDGDMAALQIDNKAPVEAQDSVLLGKPRKSDSSSALIRAFSAVFSN